MVRFDRFYLRWLLTILLLSGVCASAQEVTKEDVIRIYEQKLALVERCRVTFNNADAITAQGETHHRIRNRETFYIAGTKIRIETYVLNGAGDFEPLSFITDDGEEYRQQSFGNGVPDFGAIRRSESDPINRMAGLFSTPLGHSGLISYDVLGVYRSEDGPSIIGGHDVLGVVRSANAVVHGDMRTAPNGEPAVLVEHIRSGGTILRFWLSTERNLALLHFELAYERDGAEVVSTRVENSDFEEVAEGLFLPRLSSFKSSGGPPGMESSSTACVDAQYDLNPAMEADLFRLDFPAGVQVQDDILEIIYDVGENGEALSERPMKPVMRISRKFLTGAAMAAMVTLVVALPLGIYIGRRGAMRDR